jgi:L-ascorbate metabolism protein UlaG (beta-lactamase superfamily)
MVKRNIEVNENRKEGLILQWFGHSCFRININETSLFFDPVRKNNLLRTILDPKKENSPSAVLISHEHWDHCDPDTLIALCSKSTIIYGPKSIENPIIHGLSFEMDELEELKEATKRISMVKPHDILLMNDIKIKCLEAQEGLSYLLLIDDRRLLFMGDSVATPEMISEDPDVILFPIWAILGEEAKLDDFLTLAQSSLCIPMHYHTTSSALPNFFVDLKKVRELIPNVDLKILNRNETFKI